MRVLAIALTAFVTLIGCAPPVEHEGRKSTTSRLLAPRATVVAPASKETKEKLGVSTWRIYRSKRSLHMTGFDDLGKALGGLTTSFGKSKGGEDILATILNDGSGFKNIHGLVSKLNLSNMKMSAGSNDFVKAAFRDSVRANVLFRANANANPNAAAPQCGADLTAVMAKAMQCMQSPPTHKAAQAACIAAAKEAEAATAACQDVGSTKTHSESVVDPTKTGIDAVVSALGRLGSTKAATPKPKSSGSGKKTTTSSSGSTKSTGSGGDDLPDYDTWGNPIDPETDRSFDLESGLPIDEVTGEPYEPYSGLPYDRERKEVYDPDLEMTYDVDKNVFVERTTREEFIYDAETNGLYSVEDGGEWVAPDDPIRSPYEQDEYEDPFSSPSFDPLSEVPYDQQLDEPYDPAYDTYALDESYEPVDPFTSDDPFGGDDIYADPDTGEITYDDYGAGADDYGSYDESGSYDDYASADPYWDEGSSADTGGYDELGPNEEIEI